MDRWGLSSHSLAKAASEQKKNTSVSRPFTYWLILLAPADSGNTNYYLWFLLLRFLAQCRFQITQNKNKARLLSIMSGYRGSSVMALMAWLTMLYFREEFEYLWRKYRSQRLLGITQQYFINKLKMRIVCLNGCISLCLVFLRILLFGKIFQHHFSYTNRSSRQNMLVWQQNVGMSFDLGIKSVEVKSGSRNQRNVMVKSRRQPQKVCSFCFVRQLQNCLTKKPGIHIHQP